MKGLRPNISSQTIKAILMMLFAYLCLSATDTTSRHLRLLDYSAFEIMLFNGLCGSAYLYALYRILPRKGRGIFKNENLKQHLIRGFLLATTGIAITYALQSLNLAELYTIFFLYPLMVCALSALILKEDIFLVRWTMIFIGFSGVLIATQSKSNIPFENGLAVLAALWAALSYAIGLIMTKTIGVERNIFRLALIPVMISVPLSLIGLLITKDFVMPQPMHWLYFLFAGSMMGSGIYCISAAYRMVRASLLAPFGYSQMIWGVILGYIVFGDTASEQMMAGAISYSLWPI